MNESLTRRDFGKLSAAAFGGLVAGAALQGCGKKEPAPGPGPGPGPGASNTPAKHACRGLNECKTQGADGKNACAGQGSCATVAHHDCGGKNDCANLGGCGENPGSNACATKGGCHVPMKSDHGDAWKNARAAFEKRMAAKKVTVGAAPPEAP
ncbi:MAG: hypothetical protein WD768_16410 [Phycisphaeraceae bacterium]